MYCRKAVREARALAGSCKFESGSGYMSTFISKPTREPGDPQGGVQQGVAIYAHALRMAGGDQVEALIRGDEVHGVGAALYRAPPFELSVPALTVSWLSVNLTNARVGGAVEGERLRSFDASRYALFLTPAGAPMAFRKDVPSRYINIYFHPRAFGDGDDAAPPLAVSQPLFNMVVPGIHGLVDQLVDEMESPTMLNADAADCLARLLLVHLARHLRRAPATSKALHPALLARLRDYVIAHLSERILVADLARQACLSLDCFAAACKAQTGQAPHQFVLAMRLEHAADLLRNSSLSAADVAHTCGFASQQHLTNVMRGRLGVTPGRYRESMQGTSQRVNIRTASSTERAHDPPANQSEVISLQSNLQPPSHAMQHDTKIVDGHARISAGPLTAAAQNIALDERALAGPACVRALLPWRR